MSVKRVDVPVLVVGAGPAGLTTSLLLSRHDVPSLLIDKRRAPSPQPRARGVHARAMEILRVCGVESDLRRLELPIRPGAEWRPTLTTAAFREDTMGPADDVSPCEGLAISQDVFEQVLLEHTRRPVEADVRLGVEMESFDVVSDGVLAVLRDSTTGEVVEALAQFLVAADGAHSRIRERLGIAFEGPTDLGRQRVIAFRADLSPWTTDRPRGISFLTDHSAALIWTHPDHRWVIHMPDRDVSTDDDPIETVRDVLGIDDLELEILAQSHWTASAQAATRLKGGPAFLVGDAAHRFPPAGATGVSCAMHDAHNLAWKLAAVVHGCSRPELLETYDEERTRVAHRLAAETGTAWSRVWNADGAPFAGRSLRQLDLGHQYRSDVIVLDDSSDPDAPGSDYVPSATPGCRAPHLWLDPPRSEGSTIDLFDRDFVLLTTPLGADWPIAVKDAQQELHVPLSCSVISNPRFADLYGITPTGAVLVRPDGHVAWRANALIDPATARSQVCCAVAKAACAK